LANISAKTKQVEVSPNLVYFEDRGAVYGGPLDVVWDFWEKDETYHAKAHTSKVRNFRVKEVSKLTSVVRYEKLEAGSGQRESAE
jgi:hypothetical protein